MMADRLKKEDFVRRLAARMNADEAKEINRWAMYPRKPSTASLPEALKDECIETVRDDPYFVI
jgi:hypothetical protein